MVFSFPSIQCKDFRVVYKFISKLAVLYSRFMPPSTESSDMLCLIDLQTIA